MALTRCKKIVTCHDVIPARYPSVYFGVHDGGPRIGLAIERRRYQSADLVVAISDATERDARALLGVSGERMVRVYNAVDVERWQQEPQFRPAEVLMRHGLGQAPFVLYVGGPDWHKNIDGMFAGLATARAQVPEIVLAWVGKLNEAKRAELFARARQHRVESALKFLGFVSDEELSVLYRQAAAHVLVSWCEGFGLTVVEAMAAGCPVLTTSGGSLEEVAGDAALKVEPGDPAAIGAALVRLVRSPALRAELIQRGRARAPQFTRSLQAKGMIGAYRALLERS
jgi:glycosyltransferase involved in cell wall biosynthesis